MVMHLSQGQPGFRQHSSIGMILRSVFALSLMPVDLSSRRIVLAEVVQPRGRQITRRVNWIGTDLDDEVITVPNRCCCVRIS